jgi:hypothetical protein
MRLNRLSKLEISQPLAKLKPIHNKGLHLSKDDEVVSPMIGLLVSSHILTIATPLLSYELLKTAEMLTETYDNGYTISEIKQICKDTKISYRKVNLA